MKMTTMNNIKILNLAIDVAKKAHCNQKDKAGEEYIYHPLRVSERCDNMDEKIVAVLHDTIEDTYVTDKYLYYLKFPPHIIEAVLSVTRKKNEPYDEFIKRCKNNPIGKIVKINDLRDNLDLTRLKEISEKDVFRINKYLKALDYLLS